MLGRVDVESFLRPAVDREVGLAVAGEIEVADGAQVGDWLFEDAGRDGPAPVVAANLIHVRNARLASAKVTTPGRTIDLAGPLVSRLPWHRA